ncbi:MAG: PhnD/SsuA/transferrin family substrate-binding protein [Acidobacteriota bacterium]
MRNKRVFRWLLLASGFAWLDAVDASAAGAEEPLTFIGVALDQDTRTADAMLQDYLQRKAELEFASEELEYTLALDRLANWRSEDGHFLARTTPYVYVAAEMLGADFEILATYRSAATGKRTYGSYFVVSAEEGSPTNLEELVAWLEARPEPASFVFHSKFSTSSFFLPSLFLRQRNVYHMPESTEALIALHSRQIEENSSTRLVDLVATGQADLAAVWDGTKARFEPGHPEGLYETLGHRVRFLRVPATLPNDLLVCSADLDASTKARLRSAIASLGPTEISHGDFLSWESIREATDARRALAGLRWAARFLTPPVTVEIQPQDSAAVPEELLEATRQAVRLSGTEFRLYDSDYHEHIDYRWQIEAVHDGAMVLRSSLPGSGLAEQEFQISFRDDDSLVGRLVSILHTRMHRIRYVWPYSEGAPSIIRDTATALTPGSQVKVQRITWMNPSRNDFRQGPLFDAEVTDAGFYRYRLEPNDFIQAGGTLEFNALSNVGYRVILVVPQTEQRLFRWLTQVFVGLLVLAALAAIFDLSRRRRRSEPYWDEQTRTSALTRTRPPSSDPRGSSGSGSGSRGFSGRVSSRSH